jgi:anaerobic selenocysteine-containing dehydrogenase
LQDSPEGSRARQLRIHPMDAARAGLKTGESVQVSQAGARVVASWTADATLAPGCVWFPAGLLDLPVGGARFGALEIMPAAAN